MLLKPSYAELAADNARLKADKAQLAADKAQLEADNARLKADNATSEASLRDAVAEIETLKAERADIEAAQARALSEANARIEALELELIANRKRIEELTAEIQRLKKLPGKPKLSPNTSSDMDAEDGNSKKKKKEENKNKKKKPRGPKKPPRAPVEKIRLSVPDPEPDWKPHGRKTFICFDAQIMVRVIEYEREVLLKPDGRTVVAPLPEGMRGHLSPSLVFLILILYHQGRMTGDAITRLLKNCGLDLDKRTVLRVLTENNEVFTEEANAVLEAGLETAKWLSIDDTGMRHGGKNGYCTQIGNDGFAFFIGTDTKSRLNILTILNGEQPAYTINDAAFEYMDRVGVPKTAVESLANSAGMTFEDEEKWRAHLDALKITGVNTVRLVTEAALWGSADSRFDLSKTVFMTDEAPQFNFAVLHALCWVHCERQYHKLTPLNDEHAEIIEGLRDRIWELYKKLLRYCAAPSGELRQDIETTFDTLFAERTGFRYIDELQQKVQLNRAKMLRILDYPIFRPNSNGSEYDLRDPVTRRKVSGGTRSPAGRTNRHAMASLRRTCEKLGIRFSDYLADRLKVPGVPDVPPLADVIRDRAAEDQQQPP